MSNTASIIMSIPVTRAAVTATCEGMCSRKPFVLPTGCPKITAPVIPDIGFCTEPILRAVPNSPIDVPLTLACPVPKLKLSGAVCGKFEANASDNCRMSLELKVPEISISGTCGVVVQKEQRNKCDNAKYKISAKTYSIKPVLECIAGGDAYVVTRDDGCNVESELHLPRPKVLKVNIAAACNLEPSGTLIDNPDSCENTLRLRIPKVPEMKVVATCGGDPTVVSDGECQRTFKIPKVPEVSFELAETCGPPTVTVTRTTCASRYLFKIPKPVERQLLFTHPREYPVTGTKGIYIETCPLTTGVPTCTDCKVNLLVHLPFAPPMVFDPVVTQVDVPCTTGSFTLTCSFTVSYCTLTEGDIPKFSGPFAGGVKIRKRICIPKPPEFAVTYTKGDDQHGYTPGTNASPAFTCTQTNGGYGGGQKRVLQLKIPAPPPPVTMTCTATGDRFAVTRAFTSFQGIDGTVHRAMQWKFMMGSNLGLFSGISCIPWLVKTYKRDESHWDITMCDGYVLDIASGYAVAPIFSGRVNQTLRDGWHYLYYEYSYDYHIPLPDWDTTDGSGVASDEPRGLFWRSSWTTAHTNCILVLVASLKAEEKDGKWEAVVNQRALGTLSVIRSVPEAI